MTPSRRKASLIFNPVAGRGNEDLDRLRDALAESFDVNVFSTSPKRDADVCTRDSLKDHPDVVVVAGGDGTVSMVAGELVGTDVALGIIPRGTSNSISVALGIPADEPGALQTIRDGAIHVFDSAKANGKSMLLHASVGFHAATIGETSREEKNRWGVLAYFRKAFSKLFAFDHFQVKIDSDDKIVRCRATNVMVANAAPAKTVLAQGPAEVVPDDGALDVTIVAAKGFVEAFATGIHLLRTAAQQEAATRDNVGFLKARRVRIETKPAQPVLIDGEPAGKGRLVVECLPRSIRVLVPPDAQAAVPAPGPSVKLEGLPNLGVAKKA